MQTKPKPAPRRPAKTAGEDPWGPWIELVLGIGRALWGGGDRHYPPAQACVGSEAAGAAGQLVLVHSSATVVLPARKPRRKTLRLVARVRADA